MSKSISVIVAGLVLLAANMSSAATLDFLAMANVKEEAVEKPGPVVPIENIHVPIATTVFGFGGFAGDTLAQLTEGPFAYLDKGDAGLGVCQAITSARQCSIPSDDNLQFGEVLGLAWQKAVSVSALFFRGEAHPNDTFDVADNFSVSFDSGASWQQLGLVNAKTGLGVSVNARVKAGDFMLLASGDSKEQFYLSAAEVSEVPLPAAAWLLLAGLGGLGALRRRNTRA